MKKITVYTTSGGQVNFLSEDDKAEELKKKLEEGVGNLTSSSDDMYAWMNISNVVQITMVDFVPEEPAVIEAEVE